MEERGRHAAAKDVQVLLNKEDYVTVMEQRGNNAALKDVHQHQNLSKADELYLYIPPHSAHIDGMMKGIIYGEVKRCHWQCSKREVYVEALRGPELGPKASQTSLPFRVLEADDDKQLAKTQNLYIPQHKLHHACRSRDRAET